MLSGVTSLLSTQAGSLIYYLIVLFVLEAGVAIAWGQWRRSRDVWPYSTIIQARVQTIALAGMIGLRALLVVVALITRGSPAGVAWTSPLERAIDVVSLGLLAWAFVPALRSRLALSTVLIATNTLAATVFYIILAALWSKQVALGSVPDPADYTLSSQ